MTPQALTDRHVARETDLSLRERYANGETALANGNSLAVARSASYLRTCGSPAA